MLFFITNKTFLVGKDMMAVETVVATLAELAAKRVSKGRQKEEMNLIYHTFPKGTRYEIGFGHDIEVFAMINNSERLHV